MFLTPPPAPPYRPEDLAGFVAATLAAIRDGDSNSLWFQGLRCWGEPFIPGWPGDNAYAPRFVEAHGDTLCIGIAQDDRWMVVEIDEPVGWDPLRVACKDAKAVRLYTCATHMPDRGWLQSPVQAYARGAAGAKVFG